MVILLAKSKSNALVIGKKENCPFQVSKKEERVKRMPTIK